MAPYRHENYSTRVYWFPEEITQRQFSSPAKLLNLVTNETIENSAIPFENKVHDKLKVKKMSSSDISSVTEQLAKTKVQETHELSFKGKGLNLNNASDGKNI